MDNIKGLKDMKFREMMKAKREYWDMDERIVDARVMDSQLKNIQKLEDEYHKLLFREEN